MSEAPLFFRVESAEIPEYDNSAECAYVNRKKRTPDRP